MGLEPGTHLGGYEIVALLGAGGMGEVYRAKDTKLGRDVALKILPVTFTKDPERVARFRREAQVLASLNHSHIGAIYGLEEANDGQFLVLELVDGESLDKRIARGRIPVDEALGIATQIAEALEAAHEKGIVHRDLKPANVAVRQDGQVKVLDFGLAKATDAASGTSLDVTNSPTITTPAMVTGIGVILGTAAYMAPEQARGKALDKRVDIWAFGCLLFEMLTQQRAFDAEDVSLTLAEVMKSEPPWTMLPTLPPPVLTCLRRCFRKDPRHRLRDIGEMRLALEGLLDSDSPVISGNGPHGSIHHVWRWTLPLAAAAAAVSAAITLWLRPAPAHTAEPVRFEIHAPAGGKIPPGTPAISPDGRRVAYVVTDTDGIGKIYLRDMASTQSRVLADSDNAVHPFWSPDGRSLAFSSNRTLKRIDLAGGPPRELARISGPWHGSWGQFGDVLFELNLGVSRVPAEGGPPGSAYSNDAKAGEQQSGFPAFLPDGRRFLVGITRNDGGRSLYLTSLDSPDKKLILNDVFSAVLVAPTPSHTTYLVYLRDDALVAHEFDEHAGVVKGTPRLIVDHIGRVGNPAWMPTAGVSPTGALAYQTGGDFVTGVLSWVKRTGEQVGSVVETGLNPSLSPDGLWVATLGQSTRGGVDVLITDLTRGITSRLTRDGGAVGTVVWSPDSRRVAFARSGKILVKNIDGSTDESVLADVLGIPNSWSADGKYLLYSRLGKLFLWPLTGGTSISVGSRTGSIREGRFSPDGRYIAYVSDEEGRDEVYIQPLPPATGRIRVSAAGGAAPRWNPDGRELFFFSGDFILMGVDVEMPTLRAGIPRKLFQFGGLGTLGYDVSTDGQRFITARRRVDAPDTPITVVLNWWAALAQ